MISGKAVLVGVVAGVMVLATALADKPAAVRSERSDEINRRAPPLYPVQTSTSRDE